MTIAQRVAQILREDPELAELTEGRIYAVGEVAVTLDQDSEQWQEWTRAAMHGKRVEHKSAEWYVVHVRHFCASPKKLQTTFTLRRYVEMKGY